MAIACSTSAFKIPLDEALSEVASLGFGHVDLICIPGWGHVVPADLARDWDTRAAEVETLVKKHGLTPVALNCSFGNPYERDDDEANAQRLREVEAVARLAVRVGVGLASFFPGGNRPAEEMDWDDVLAAEVESVREMLSAGGAHGVTLAIEPHFDTPFQTVEQVERLLEALPELGLAYDPSHFAMQEIALRETEPFLDRAVHVHLRDAAPGKMQELFGEGTVDFDRLLDALAERRYGGHFSIEYLPGLPGDARREISKLKGKLEERLG